jgi:hypothetical protein
MRRHGSGPSARYFSAKSRDDIGLGRERRVQRLECDLAPRDHVRRAIDRAKPAGGEAELDPVAAIEHRSNERIDGRHLRAVRIRVADHSPL